MQNNSYKHSLHSNYSNTAPSNKHVTCYKCNVRGHTANNCHKNVGGHGSHSHGSSKFSNHHSNRDRDREHNKSKNLNNNYSTTHANANKPAILKTSSTSNTGSPSRGVNSHLSTSPSVTVSRNGISSPLSLKNNYKSGPPTTKPSFLSSTNANSSAGVTKSQTSILNKKPPSIISKLQQRNQNTSSSSQISPKPAATASKSEIKLSPKPEKKEETNSPAAKNGRRLLNTKTVIQAKEPKSNVQEDQKKDQPPEIPAAAFNLLQSPTSAALSKQLESLNQKSSSTISTSSTTKTKSVTNTAKPKSKETSSTAPVSASTLLSDKLKSALTNSARVISPDSFLDQTSSQSVPDSNFLPKSPSSSQPKLTTTKNDVSSDEDDLVMDVPIEKTLVKVGEASKNQNEQPVVELKLPKAKNLTPKNSSSSVAASSEMKIKVQAQPISEPSGPMIFEDAPASPDAAPKSKKKPTPAAISPNPINPIESILTKAKTLEASKPNTLPNGKAKPKRTLSRGNSRANSPLTILDTKAASPVLKTQNSNASSISAPISKKFDISSLNSLKKDNSGSETQSSIKVNSSNSTRKRPNDSSLSSSEPAKKQTKINNSNPDNQSIQSKATSKPNKKEKNQEKSDQPFKQKPNKIQKSPKKFQEKATEDYNCWVCHKGGELLCCDSDMFCYRVYHPLCAEEDPEDSADDWICPECEKLKIFEKSEMDTLYKYYKDRPDFMTEALLGIIVRLEHDPSSLYFREPVDTTLNPDYKKYIALPMDLRFGSAYRSLSCAHRNASSAYASSDPKPSPMHHLKKYQIQKNQLLRPPPGRSQMDLS